MNYNLLINYGSSLVDKNKITHIIELLKSVTELNGDVCEVGVYRGGTAKIISENINDCNLFLFDTFGGMPYYDLEKDKDWDVGTFNQTDYDMVSNLFKNKPNVEVYKGIFPSETSHNIQDKKFKFVHLDVDNYQPYKESLEFFYDKMVPGGVILFDDYDCNCCPGANKAVDEFLSDKPEEVQKNVGVFIVKI
jgi:O-methyltransferase